MNESLALCLAPPSSGSRSRFQALPIPIGWWAVCTRPKSCTLKIIWF